MINQIIFCNHHKRNYRQYIQSAMQASLGTLAPVIQWDKVSESLPLQAHIYRGYLVVRCDTCGGQVYYQPGEPFFCPDCLNAMFGGLPRLVNMPPEFAEIERLLVMRPMLENRNWEPGETIEELIAENIQYLGAKG